MLHITTYILIGPLSRVIRTYITSFTTLPILISTLKTNNLGDMPRHTLNPSLNSRLRQILPTLGPSLFSLLSSPGCAFFSSTSLHPGPTWLNCIQVWRVPTLRHSENIHRHEDGFLIFGCMCRGLILHNLRIRTFKFTLLRKLEKLRNKYLLLVPIPGDSPLLPRDSDLSSSCSELPLRFLSTKVL